MLSTNTLAYYSIITTVKSFIVQAPCNSLSWLIEFD
jgi:hypothetical protein